MSNGSPRQQWNVLLVEDDEDDYVLVRAWLSEARSGEFVIQWAKSYQSALEAVAENQPDAILADYDLGGYNGLELTEELQALGCGSPVILLTGRGSYDLDLAAMEAGVTDYLSKHEVTPLLLERAIRYAIYQKEHEKELEMANQVLEDRVQERTQELVQRTESLLNEITHRERIEHELAEVQSRLIDRAEAERLELAQDLHDGPMQELYGIAYRLSAMKTVIPEDELRQDLEACQDDLQEVIRHLRATAGELRPPALVPYGLEKALRSHAETFIKNHPELDVHLDLMPDENVIDEQVRLVLYRIYQIAVTNIIRHADAKRVDVRLRLDQEHVTMEVQDDGRGFKVPGRWFEFAHKGHLGLAGAAERSEAVGGHLEVHSDLGRGTLLRTIIPLSEERKSPEEMGISL